MKLSKIVFSVKRFTTDCLQFSGTIVKISLLRGHLGTRHQIQAFQGFLSGSAIREATRTFTFW